jgi:hypothetical protein
MASTSLFLKNPQPSAVVDYVFVGEVDIVHEPTREYKRRKAVVEEDREVSASPLRRLAPPGRENLQRAGAATAS